MPVVGSAYLQEIFYKNSTVYDLCIPKPDEKQLKMLGEYSCSLCHGGNERKKLGTFCQCVNGYHQQCLQKHIEQENVHVCAICNQLFSAVYMSKSFRAHANDQISLWFEELALILSFITKCSLVFFGVFLSFVLYFSHEPVIGIILAFMSTLIYFQEYARHRHTWIRRRVSKGKENMRFAKLNRFLWVHCMAVVCTASTETLLLGTSWSLFWSHTVPGAKRAQVQVAQLLLSLNRQNAQNSLPLLRDVFFTVGVLVHACLFFCACTIARRFYLKIFYNLFLSRGSRLRVLDKNLADVDVEQ